MNERLKGYAEELDIPGRLGYAEVQTVVDIENAIYLGATSDYLDDKFSALTRFKNSIIASNIREEKIATPFLIWVREKYNPQFVYYPFSGWHITPREIFGQDRVVHLSNDDNNPFLRDIGSGIRVRGDVSRQPFRDEVFDVIFLNRHDVRGKDRKRIFAEFRRVLKEDGLFVVDSDQRNIVNYCRKNLQPVDIPEEIVNVAKSSFALFQNRDRERRKFLWWWR